MTMSSGFVTTPEGRRLPDFVIGGAPRCGTTWLTRALDRYPGITMARPIQPEPKFFLVDELYAKGIEHYASRWFEDIPADQVAGEKSTNYLESEAAARRMAAHLPHIRLIFLLREPADRAWSNYLWSRMNGLEDQDFGDALALEEQRDAEVDEDLRYAHPHAYASRGFYAELLTPWFRLFERDRILCLRYEDIATEPGRLVTRVHSFLDLPARPRDGWGLGIINPSERTERPDPEVMAQLRERFEEPNQRLHRLLGRSSPLWKV